MRSKDLHRYFLILLLGSCPLSCLFAAKSYVRLSACAHELPSLCRSDVIHEGGLSAVHSRGNLAAKSTQRVVSTVDTSCRPRHALALGTSPRGHRRLVPARQGPDLAWNIEYLGDRTSRRVPASCRVEVQCLPDLALLIFSCKGCAGPQEDPYLPHNRLDGF